MKKIISIIITLLMLSNITVAFAEVDIIANGKCGTNLTWTLDNDGNLIINGTGDMSLWLGSEIHAPWYIYRTDIKDVVIENGVTNIGHSAFEDCSNLTGIAISDSVLSIGNCAFQSCTNLASITIPNGVTNIGSAAFEYCKNLTNITIPKSVTNIGSSAFYGCNALESITYEGSKNDWNNITISYMNSVLDNAEIVFLMEETQDKKICSVCEDEIINGSEFYDDDGNIMCELCSKNQNIELKCPHCSEILEITEDEYNERESIVCPDCMKFIIYEGEDTEYECSDCGEVFYHSETKVVENGKIYCPYCNKIVDGDNMETEIECYICGEYFNADDMLYDEDDNLICQDCYAEIQNEDEELFYIQCPYCEETFEDNEDIYDEDGYAVCPYCEGLIDTSEEIVEETEMDFATSDWAAEEVYDAYQNNLIPDEMLETALYKTISREEFAAVAVKLYENIVGEIPDVNIYDTPFTDCNYASEYNNYIAVAYELGITKGTSDTAFSPYDNITREQLATMLCRTLIIASYEDIAMDMNLDMLLDKLGRPDLLDMEDTAVSFADENEISDFAKASVYILASRDIIKGVDDLHFAPKETATKEQSILISVRCVNNLYKQ